jgi:hypothetical protein
MAEEVYLHLLLEKVYNKNGTEGLLKLFYKINIIICNNYNLMFMNLFNKSEEKNENK